MSLKEFGIVLDSPIFYTGQNITGRLVVNFSKPKLLKEIHMNYSGFGLVRWSSDGDNKEINFRGFPPFFDHEDPIFGSDEGERELTAGRHVFPFDWQLPRNLPSSFKGEFGRLKYTVKGTINGRGGLNYTTEQSITVLSVFDLNCLPIAAAPVSEKNSKTFWRRIGTLHMSLDLPVRGFVSGQIIPIKVSLNNQSEVEVESITATLCQNVLFRAGRARNHSKVQLAEEKFPIEAASQSQEVFFRIQVPALPPSYLEFCSIIDLRYHLTIEADAGIFSKNLKIETEILIGNVPVMAYEKPDRRHPTVPGSFDNENQLRSQLPAQPINCPQLALYGNFAQPTYQQIMVLGSSIRTEPDLLYPVYKFTGNKA